jgi:cytochrome b subunit of formate dehydrogenase
MHAAPLWGRRILRWRMPALFFLALAAAVAEPGAPAKPTAVPNSECLDCHEAEFKPRKKGQPAEWVGVRTENYARSAHAKLACVECHTSIEETPHPAKLPPVDCTGCHARTGGKHTFHPRLALTPVPAGRDTACGECHSAHETVAAKDAASPFADGQQTLSCGRCHEAAQQGYLSSAHGQKQEGGRRLTPDCLSCHREPIAGGSGGPALLARKVAQARLCESCHVGRDEVARQSVLGAKFVSSFDRSVHGAALQGGKAEAASCADCHGAHAMNKAAVAGARVNRLRLTDTCARCHRERADEYRTSVHAAALAKGNLDSAGCTSCHGEHDIKKPSDPASPVNKVNLAQQVCAECHASVRLTRRYGLSSETFRTFADSYHGLAVRGGAINVVNCASCHGSHAIKSQDDPASSINKRNLGHTCGECHPGANTRFTVGSVHASESRGSGSPWLYWIANLYVVLITVVIGGMSLHNALDFFRKTRRKLAVQKGEIVEPPAAHRLYLRMTVNERLQHLVLGVSFVALVLTGFMLRYPEAWWVVALRHLSVHVFEWRSFGHRAAGVVMLLSGIWHIGYILFTPEGRSLFRAMLPEWRDLTDPWKVLKYNLGLSPEKPAFGRFCYIEKAEYWAMAWGTVLMGLTGAILWFENASMGHISKLGFDIARTIHFYEAILATLAIIVWHFYFVIFNPDVYPMNLAWLTGRMSEEEMREEHPRQLAELQAAERADAGKTKPPPSPPTGMV